MLANITDYIENFVLSLGVFAPLLACFLILIESMVPILPLCVFITINFISFGVVIGFIISWVFTCLGCFLSYYLVKKGFRSWYETRIKGANMFDKCVSYVRELSLPSLTAIIALPITPAFMMNIAAGMVNMKFKKFFISICIGKIFMVYFWGFIGLSFVECFKRPIVLIKIFIMVVLAYLIAYIINKKLKKED